MNRGAANVDVTASAETHDEGGRLGQVSRRLSQRPRLLLALGFGVEVGLHLALIVVLLRSNALVSLFTALPRWELATAAAFFVALLAGFLGGYEATFPFLSWRMYSSHGASGPRIYLIDGETAGGPTVRVDRQDLVPAIGRRRLKLIVGKRAEEMRMAASEAEAELLRAQQRLTLVALGRLYNTGHPDHPLTRLHLVEATVPLDATQPPWLRDQRELASTPRRPFSTNWLRPPIRAALGDDANSPPDPLSWSSWRECRFSREWSLDTPPKTSAIRDERICGLDLQDLSPFVPSRPRLLSGRIEGPVAFIDTLWKEKGNQKTR